MTRLDARALSAAKVPQTSLFRCVRCPEMFTTLAACDRHRHPGRDGVGQATRIECVLAEAARASAR